MNHVHRRFQNPPSRSHDTVAEVIDRALADRRYEQAAIDALVGVALADVDRVFIEHCCLKMGSSTSAGAAFLGVSALCLGHAARRFGRLSAEAIQLAGALAARARHDPSDVSPNAVDGLGDITWHLRRYKNRWHHGRHRVSSW
ncbi:hypothetical protein [Glycomyces arizonensis]|uniref:hypothetical protein n=1 Tax=Glycomyces arizonensis TaxID=256035 RepID=UPI000687066E|nr:hypothetical protein [Glycomyces arizonensis]